MNLRKQLKLYLVTDESLGFAELLEKIEEAVKEGVSAVQLREKRCSGKEFCEKAARIKKLLKRYNIPLIINDRVDVALICGAEGVHIGQSDLPADKVRALIPDNMILGVSVRSLDQAVKAEQAGADYLGVGAVFPTISKEGAVVLERKVLREIIHNVSIPSVAIGGITAENVAELKGTGVTGIAVISAILRNGSPGESAWRLGENLEQLQLDNFTGGVP